MRIRPARWPRLVLPCLIAGATATAFGADALQSTAGFSASLPAGLERRPSGIILGPVSSWTTAWHPIPGHVAVPLGASITLMYQVPPNYRVSWSGAQELSRSRAASLALFEARSAGLHAVRVQAWSPAGQSVEDSVLLDVRLAIPSALHVSTPQVTAAPVTLDMDASNLQTMAAYFGDSVAVLRTLGPGHYVTSVKNKLGLTVEAVPTPMASLIEWRVDGQAVALGDRVSFMLSSVGTHVIEAGPPQEAAAVLVEAYEAHITSHVSDQDLVEEGPVVTFTASTNPPGHEADLVWLSSTKYGEASPVMGNGPSFMVQFANTWGPLPGWPFGTFQWLGVRCDNDRFNQDQKTGACFADGSCTDGLTGPECEGMQGSYAGHGTACQDSPCGAPSGACCVSGLCLDGITRNDCAAEAGTYEGDGSVCGSSTCDLPFGACCHDGTCTEALSPRGCARLGGVFGGPGSTCVQVECAMPVGACCDAQTCIDGQTAQECASAGGEYLGDATTCAQNDCTPLSGACCAAGLCSISSFRQCLAQAGEYQGDGSTCPAAECTLPLGACCAGAACSDGFDEPACAAGGGTFYEGQLCSGIDCSEGAAVLITEVRVDQPGPDNDEYFELSGSQGTSLNGLTYLVIGDGTGGSGVIEVVVELDGLALPPDGVALIADPTFTIGGVVPDLQVALNFENSDNFTHVLVRGFTGLLGDDLDTDDDCVLDAAPWEEMLDLIALVENDDMPPSGTECHYGPPQVGPDLTEVPSHAVRCPDGTWRIGAADPALGDDTPGALNVCT